jgi:hypothetical protein
MKEFTSFNKIPRLFRDVVITEKIDGTNASIWIPETPDEIAEIAPRPFLVGSRNRWITPEDDNYGFARWAYSNADELLKLGPGQHFGEWWGSGIQRGYGLKEKRFSLFNVGRWNEDNKPACCSVVPVLYKGVFQTPVVDVELARLRTVGSIAAPGFFKPEGVVIFHTAAGVLFKATCENDEKPKGSKE